ncbi:hypothetical protein [Nocardia vaccinii]|uniref:hypothetical protein n=1 Tax=Nocardia vaccinii TaxID=1822 RepID=UPI00083568BF|nr:hypothetical protein [Nocardia vaccinii]
MSAIGIAAPILLLLLRILQGFALGSEWAGAVFGGVIQSAPACGYRAATAVISVVATRFTDEDDRLTA